jgi:hypothetical protein
MGNTVKMNLTEMICHNVEWSHLEQNRDKENALDFWVSHKFIRILSLLNFIYFSSRRLKCEV